MSTAADDFLKTLPISHWLRVDNPRHTEVLGSRVSTPAGKHDWDVLNWDEWWLDGPEAHMFNAGGNYFHVRCRDGGDEEGCVYRVRCFYAGKKFKGREVVDISIGMRGGKLHWIVRCKREET